LHVVTYLCKTTCMTVGVYYATAGLRYGYRSQCAACWKTTDGRQLNKEERLRSAVNVIRCTQSRVGLQPTLVCQTAIVVKKKLGSLMTKMSWFLTVRLEQGSGDHWPRVRSAARLLDRAVFSDALKFQGRRYAVASICLSWGARRRRRRGGWGVGRGCPPSHRG